jgi:drug/metabolite transporter (DMT)-like permease
MPIKSGTTSWRLGLIFSLIAMVFWGILPLGLKLAVRHVDVITVTWLRFVIAFVLLLLYLTASGQLPPATQFSKRSLWLLAIATVGLALNYGLFLEGLALTTASNAEVLIQLAPALFGLGSVALLGERYTRRQWTGFGILCLGLTLFFHDQIQALLAHLDRYLMGSLMVVAAAVVWVFYAFAQKQLLRQFASSQLMVLIYGGCVIVFTPFAQVKDFLFLSPLDYSALAFCGLNTLIAYGAFGEAMAHWESSRISAVVSVSPIVTLACVLVLSRLNPQLVVPEPLTQLGWIGALTVVAGSWLIALGKPDSKCKDSEQKRYDLG